MQVSELDPLLLPISSPPWNLRVHDRKKCMPLHGPKHPIDYLCQSVTIILGTSVHQRVKSCAYIIMICYDCSLYDLQYCQCVLLANSCNLKGGTSYSDLCSKDTYFQLIRVLALFPFIVNRCLQKFNSVSNIIRVLWKPQKIKCCISLQSL